MLAHLPNCKRQVKINIEVINKKQSYHADFACISSALAFFIVFRFTVKQERHNVCICPPPATLCPPSEVEALAGETFTQREIIDALGATEGQLVAAVTRFGMFLISDKVPGGRAGRRFHYLDALALLVFVAFDKHFGPAGRKTLVNEISCLLFGDPMSEAERDERRAEVTKKFDALKTPSGRAKFGGRMFKMHQQRRAEIKRDFWSANPLWWSRDADRRWVIFGCDNHTIYTGLFDRRDDDGKISFEKLAAIKAGTWVNATEWFCRADGQLAAVVGRRMVGAD